MNSDDNAEKTIHILFYSSPNELIAENGALKRLKLERNRLEGEAGTQKKRSPLVSFMK